MNFWPTAVSFFFSILTRTFEDSVFVDLSIMAQNGTPRTPFSKSFMDELRIVSAGVLLVEDLIKKEGPSNSVDDSMRHFTAKFPTTHCVYSCHYLPPSHPCLFQLFFPLFSCKQRRAPRPWIMGRPQIVLFFIFLFLFFGKTRKSPRRESNT